MAAVNHTTDAPIGSLNFYAKWTPITNGDTPDAKTLEHGAGIGATVQAIGTFTGTVQLLGSLDGTNYSVLVLNGSNIEFTDEGVLEFSTRAPFIKPSAPTTGSVTIIACG